MTHDGTSSEHLTCRSIAKTNLCWSSVDHLLLSSFSHLDWNASIVLITRALFSWSSTSASLTSFYFELFIYNLDPHVTLLCDVTVLAFYHLFPYLCVSYKVDFCQINYLWTWSSRPLRIRFLVPSKHYVNYKLISRTLSFSIMIGVHYII